MKPVAAGVGKIEGLSSKAGMLFNEIEGQAGKTSKITIDATSVVNEIKSVLSTQDGKQLFNFTKKTIKRMEDTNRTIPIQTLDDIIKFPISVTKDPQGTSALMYYSQLWKDGKLYNVEVLYDQTSNTIMHFLYTRESLGSLTKLK